MTPLESYKQARDNWFGYISKTFGAHWTYKSDLVARQTVEGAVLYMRYVEAARALSSPKGGKK